MDTSNSCRVSSINSLLCFISVRYQLSGNSVIDNIILSYEGDYMLHIFYSTDKAWFHFRGYVNSQNFRIWSAEKSHAVHRNHLHSSKIGLWCAVSRKWIVAQLFFEETLGEKNYHNIWLNFLFCGQKMKVIAGFSNMGPIVGKQQQLSCRSS
jgi:hypothetical protein